MKPRTIALLPLLALLIAPAGAMFTIDGMYTDEGQQWLKEHWGENITIGELQRISYEPGIVRQIEDNVDPDLLRRVRNQSHYWGSRVPWGDEGPECPYGATVWNESGPVKISALSDVEKREMGIDVNVVTDASGYRVIGHMDNRILEGGREPFRRVIPEGLSAFAFDLFWEDPGSSLKATLFAPDGVLGPYHDADDGREDGRIFLQVSRPGGVAAGEWFVIVEAEETPPSGQPFMLVVY